MSMLPCLATMASHNTVEPIVALRDVAMSYGTGTATVRAIGQISLQVHCGEVLYLMGPSGSGKTSLLQIIGLLLRPTVGEVALHGEVLTDLDERHMSNLRRRHCGYVFQSYNLFPTLTALDNVLVACEVKGMRRSEAMGQAMLLLDRVGLSAKRDSYPAWLSGGQKQRVAVARALAGNPPIILADEPTAALDSETGRQVAKLLSELARQDGHAVVTVTHDTRMSVYADRIVTLQDGMITTNGLNAGD